MILPSWRPREKVSDRYLKSPIFELINLTNFPRALSCEDCAPAADPFPCCCCNAVEHNSRSLSNIFYPYYFVYCTRANSSRELGAVDVSVENFLIVRRYTDKFLLVWRRAKIRKLHTHTHNVSKDFSAVVCKPLSQVHRRQCLCDGLRETRDRVTWIRNDARSDG